MLPESPNPDSSVGPDLLDALVPAVVATLPPVASRIPSGASAELVRTWGGSYWAGSGEALLAARLLGALELTIEGLRLDPPAALVTHLRPVGQWSGSVAVATGPDAGAQDQAMAVIAQLRPELPSFVVTLFGALAADDRVAPLLRVPPDLLAEEQIAAEFGRVHLALAVIGATATARAADVPIVGASPAAVMGMALHAVRVVLPTRPLPPAYAAARLARRRAEYVLPRFATGQVTVVGHRWALCEGSPTDLLGEPVNGLVTVILGGLVVRTGVAEGFVDVVVRILEGPPGEVETVGWDEVVDVSYTAIDGAASIVGGDGDSAAPGLAGLTFPWPGDVRVRVSARGRDDGDAIAGGERYQLDVWRAAYAAEVHHQHRDRLGHRLRGEPEPPAPAESPAARYRWIRQSSLADAATVTVVTGLSAADVLRAFGADPDLPEPSDTQWAEATIDPWVSVLPLRGAVLAIEFNGWQASSSPTLRYASARGRSASMYWNVNAATRLSFASAGEVLGSFEPNLDPAPSSAEVSSCLDGLDFSDDRYLTWEIGLVAVQRFTGAGPTAADLAALESTGIAHRILPWLPELYPQERLPDGTRRWPGHGPLGAATDRLALLADQDLVALAWWAAGCAAVHAGLDQMPCVADSLAARALTTEAQVRARRSQLHDHSKHLRAWAALHAATNPDPLGAAIGALDDAQFALGADAGWLVTAAVGWIDQRLA